MAHLLLIENWVEGTGRLFPKAIRDLGHTFTFITRNPSHYLDETSEKMHPIFFYAKNILTAETNDIDSLMEFLSIQHQALKFDGVLTICDYYVDTVCQVARALKLPQSFSSNVKTIRRKHLVREALERAGLPNPRFIAGTDWSSTRKAAANIGYPLIAKPSDLASSAYVQLVRNEDELRAAYDKLTGFTHNFRDQPRDTICLLEEYMDGAEVSVEAITHQGKTSVLGITDKSLTGLPYFIEDGHMFPADLPEEKFREIVDFARAALEAVGHDHGISHTEVKLTSKGPRLVEINPRPGGNYIVELIQRVTGIDLLNVHIELALDRQPDLSSLENIQGSAAIKFLIPQSRGKLIAINGEDQLKSCANVQRWTLKNAQQQDIYPPIDNACYLGFVITHDESGMKARDYAEQAIMQLTPDIQEEAEA
ncbi:ATP-grasp domain-containing protein [uncultured Microbulbifer sp.]|uniref:ATP-grasp domain-containing protein n=1 Tax=uncultured Microbulbifer sp. TaxID=348147 RepID=UPI0026070EC2|nr:ATP-grasp domain-containing protein [uncultured Microbulbifer sp.]